MKKRLCFLLIFWLLCDVQTGFCLDWKKLHEEADTMSLQNAQVEAQKAPKNIGKLYVLGLVSLTAHKDNDAAEAFTRIRALDPTVIEARWGQAEVLRRQHDLVESEKILNEVLRARPLFFPAMVSLAYLKYTQFDLQKTVSLASRVLSYGQKADKNDIVRANLLIAGAKGTIAHNGGLVSKLVNGTVVLSYLHSAQRLAPDSDEVFLGLGSYYLLAPAFAGGDYDAAEKYLIKAIAADPLLVDSYVRLAQLYHARKEDAKYRLYLDKAMKIDPMNELALDTKSGACRFICKR